MTPGGPLRLGAALRPWHALAGRPALPGWAARSGDPLPARDGDLLTAWRCSQAADGPPCAIGVTLGKKATVHALRLFFAGAAPPSVRVHVDGGWAEATIRPAGRYQHLIFDPPLETKGLVLEVVAKKAEAKKAEEKKAEEKKAEEKKAEEKKAEEKKAEEKKEAAKKEAAKKAVAKKAVAKKAVAKKAEANKAVANKAVALAELELFGAGGSRRPPMQLDPRAAVAVTDKKRFWNRKGDAATAWVEIVDGKGQRRRLLRGTEIIGAAADRFIIVRTQASVDCSCESGGPEPRYTYALVDRETRLFYALTKLTGPYLHIAKKGIRYTTVRSHYCEFNGKTYYDSVRIEASGRARWRRWRSARHQLKLRGFTHYKQASGSKACPRLKSKALRSLVRRFRSGSRCVSAGEWLVFLGAGECTPRYSIAATINRETGDVGQQKRCRGRYVPVEARTLPGGVALVQIPRLRGDAADLYTVGADGTFQQQYENAFLAVPTSPGGEMCLGMACP